MADETTVSNRAELATFVRYVHSDSNDVKKFLGIVQIKGNKSAAQKKSLNFFVTRGLNFVICDSVVWME